MVSVHTEQLQHDIKMIRAWIEHWRDDAARGLACTDDSIQHALIIANRALEEVRQMEAI